MNRILIIILLLFFFFNLFSQDFYKRRSHSLIIFNDTLKVDTFSIVPGTIMIVKSDNSVVLDSLYKVDYAKAIIRFDSSLKNEKLTISYEPFKISFSKEVFHKDIYQFKFQQDLPKNTYYYYKSTPSSETNINENKIIKSGNLSRGITLGNNQDASVSSNLNLQLSGKLSEKLNVLAAISDENVPIQPDGYTQQLQEFDKVFIQLYTDKTSVVFGDYELSNYSGYFMRYTKKLLGVHVKNSLYFPKNSINDTLINTISTAVSKGMYNRYQLDNTEGNQGPYRLKGANNESFIILLAGTEKVYIDGKLLKRGEDNDYIMDYNVGEITFTPNQPITKDKRIMIEFEYSDRNYTRVIFQNSNEYHTETGKFWLNIYSEQDNKNQSLQQDLKNEHKQLLSSIGDSLQNAIVLNIDSSSFENDKVFYRKIDTIVESLYYQQVFVYSINPENAFYKLGFSYVGEGNGHYIVTRSSANGKVYRWIAPVNGILQGNYEPTRILVSPKKQQLISMGSETAITSFTSAFIDLSLSNNDQNTFSNLNDNDNIGVALRFNMKQKLLSLTSRSDLTASGGYQLISQRFQPLERFRSVEFERDWNIETMSSSLNENLFHTGLNFYNKDLGIATLNNEWMNKENEFNAFRNEMNANIKKYGYNLQFNGSFLSSNTVLNSTSFLRHYTVFSKEIGKITLGISNQSEDNKWKLRSTDSLLGNSFFYHQYGAFLRSTDTSRNTYLIEYKNRKDFLPINNKLTYSSLANDFTGSANFNKNKNNILKTTLNYRELKLINTTNSGKDENTALGRIDHSLRIFKSFISTNTIYELGSGMEIKKEFSYIEVAAGEGIYTWKDYNSNFIKELNEFVIANYSDEASYIRILNPTNEYIKAYSNQFSESFYIQPKNLFRKKNKISTFISRFDNQFAYKIQNKNTESKLAIIVNPFSTSITDSSIIFNNQSYRNTLSFNKFNSKWGIDYIYNESKDKSLMVNGFNSKMTHMDIVKIRIRIWEELIYYNDLEQNNKKVTSEFFKTNNYTLVGKSEKNALKWTPNLKSQFVLSYEYTESKNVLGIEKCYGHNSGTEFSYAILKDGNLTTSFNYIYFNYKYPSNSPVAYEMLQSLLPGKNLTWNLLLQKRLANGLEINISYNGRKSQETNTIHSGTVQVRASF